MLYKMTTTPGGTRASPAVERTKLTWKTPQRRNRHDRPAPKWMTYTPEEKEPCTPDGANAAAQEDVPAVPFRPLEADGQVGERDNEQCHPETRAAAARALPAARARAAARALEASKKHKERIEGELKPLSPAKNTRNANNFAGGVVPRGLLPTTKKNLFGRKGKEN